MEFLILIILSIFPSIGIYYFSYGNWPLAYKLQIGFSIFLLIYVIVIIMNMLSNGFSSGGRGSNNIGAGGALIGMVIIIGVGCVLINGSISFLYRGKLAGTPGILNPYIKWGTIIIVGGATVILLPAYIRSEYIHMISYLPNYVKHPIYLKKINGSLSHNEEHQFKGIIEKNILQSDEISDILILSKNETLLYYILEGDFWGSDNKKIIDNAKVADNQIKVIQSFCSKKEETNYPNKAYRLQLLELLNHSKTNTKVILEYIKCIDPTDADAIDTGATFYKDDEFITLVWTQYPYLRPYYFHRDGKKQIEIISKIIKEEPLTNLEVI